ncbi:hypothetical protein DFH08DRAFT_1082624 [Mycena albidolilacea]|uniref:Uncharacterized protein n=1 Tax=Mycena albidolilacea TaxID=1033008 RepID=A0AAD6ZUZ1_9AGAR|nr:hypothetical protein DFH08DRAFT_1082624 [Mycena albidolilacea]
MPSVLNLFCFNKAHGPRYKFWDVGVHPRNALPPTSRTPLRPPLRFLCADSHRKTPSPPARQMCRMYTPRKCAVRDAPLQGLLGLMISHCRIHETRPTALSTSTRQILDAGLAEAAAAFPAPRRHQRELPHQRLARQQEAAAHLAALTPLLPSPSIGQAELMPPPPQSRGPFMPMGTRPHRRRRSTDSAATLTHPDDQQRFAYGYAPEHQRFQHDSRQPEGGYGYEHRAPSG